MPRAEYPVHPGIKVNGIAYKRVIIDGHYKEKHAPPMTDSLIMTLCHLVSGQDIPVDDVRGSFVFMVVERLPYLQRVYKLILVVDKNDDFLGVVNAFPRGKGGYYALSK